MQQKSRKNMDLEKKLKNFDEVWKRVSGKEVPAAASHKSKGKQIVPSVPPPVDKAKAAKPASKPEQKRGAAKPNNPSCRRRGPGGR